MAEPTSYAIGVPARCADGICGRVKQVVVDPVTATVTHLVVEPEHREGLGRLVPVRQVEAGPDGVTLPYRMDEFDRLPRAEVTKFLPQAQGLYGYSPEQMLLWPSFGGNVSVPVTETSLPAHEVGIGRGDTVSATDGHIGHVDGLVVDPTSHHVTHVVLQEGHLFGEKDVAIPMSAVHKVGEDTIQLSLSKQEVKDLPAVEFHRAAHAR